VVGIDDPLLQEFVNRLVQLSVERNQMQFSMEKENPVLERNSREIILTQQNLKESVGNLIRASKITESDLQKRAAEMQGKLAKLPTTEQQLINIRRKYELSSTQYDFLIQKRAEAELIRAGNLPDVQVIDPAADYGEPPIKPRRMFNLALGLFFGLLGPTLYVLIRIFFSNKLETKNDLEKSSSIPIIGTIGHSSGSSNIVIQNGLKSAVAESFRIIRTNLNFVFSQNAESDSRSKVVLVTSSVGGEGKTFCSINLSSIISISGAKTIIVGLDMRKPKIFNDFRLTNDTGLSEYLSNQVEIDQIIKATTIDNLDFITAGPVPPNPGELLMSPRLGQLITELKKRYDFVVLDTPPITLVSDAPELMKFADATLYVVRQNYTTRDLLSVINEQHTKRGIKNISLIFNDVIRKGYGYDYGYNYGYNYGYGYYDEDDQKVPWWKRVF
jgi:capsular exopolysaccharide synthesis family protein